KGTGRFEINMSEGIVPSFPSLKMTGPRLLLALPEAATTLHQCVLVLGDRVCELQHLAEPQRIAVPRSRADLQVDLALRLTELAVGQSDVDQSHAVAEAFLARLVQGDGDDLALALALWRAVVRPVLADRDVAWYVHLACSLFVPTFILYHSPRQKARAVVNFLRLFCAG